MTVAKQPLNLADLGRRVRAVRLGRGLTLEQVVGGTGLSSSWLSKLENGLLSPSLEALVRLAETLECGVDVLVGGLSVPPAFVVDREGDRPAAPAKKSRVGAGVVRDPLANGWQERRMRPAILHVSGSGNRHAPEHHDGERFLLVLEGDVQVIYGDEQISLGRGDSVYLRATVPHAICSVGTKVAQVLSISSEPENAGLDHRRPRA